MAFGVGISTVKTSASDLLVQVAVEKKDLKSVDWSRNAAFATFGCIYLGGVQYAIYVPLFSRLFPNAARFAAKPLREKLKDGKGLLALFGQVFLDQVSERPIHFATRQQSKEHNLTFVCTLVRASPVDVFPSFLRDS